MVHRVNISTTVSHPYVIPVQYETTLLRYYATLLGYYATLLGYYTTLLGYFCILKENRSR